MAANQILGNTKGGSSLMLWSPNTRANTLSGQLRSGATLVREAHALAENNVTGSRRSFRAAGGPYRAVSKPSSTSPALPRSRWPAESSDDKFRYAL